LAVESNPTELNIVATILGYCYGIEVLIPGGVGSLNGKLPGESFTVTVILTEYDVWDDGGGTMIGGIGHYRTIPDAAWFAAMVTNGVPNTNPAFRLGGGTTGVLTTCTIPANTLPGPVSFAVHCVTPGACYDAVVCGWTLGPPGYFWPEQGCASEIWNQPISFTVGGSYIDCYKLNILAVTPEDHVATRGIEWVQGIVQLVKQTFLNGEPAGLTYLYDEVIEMVVNGQVIVDSNSPYCFRTDSNGMATLNWLPPANFLTGTYTLIFRCQRFSDSDATACVSLGW